MNLLFRFGCCNTFEKALHVISCTNSYKKNTLHSWEGQILKHQFGFFLLVLPIIIRPLASFKHKRAFNKRQSRTSDISPIFSGYYCGGGSHISSRTTNAIHGILFRFYSRSVSVTNSDRIQNSSSSRTRNKTETQCQCNRIINIIFIIIGLACSSGTHVEFFFHWCCADVPVNTHAKYM